MVEECKERTGAEAYSGRSAKSAGLLGSTTALTASALRGGHGRFRASVL